MRQPSSYTTKFIMCLANIATAISISKIAFLALFYLCVLHGRWEIPMKRKMLGNELKLYMEDFYQNLGLNIFLIFSLAEGLIFNVTMKKDQSNKNETRKTPSLILSLLVFGYFFFNQFKKKCKDKIPESLNRTKLDEVLICLKKPACQQNFIYAVTDNENFGNNLSSFSNFPSNIELAQGQIMLLATAFRYSRNGTTDELICNVCGFLLRGWSTDPRQPVTCSNCLSVNQDFTSVADSTKLGDEEDTGSIECAPSAQTDLIFRGNHCEGVCGDPHCRNCTEGPMHSTEIAENRESLIGDQRSATAPEDSLPLVGSVEALETSLTASNTSLCLATAQDIGVACNLDGGNDGQHGSQDSHTNESLTGTTLAVNHLRFSTKVLGNNYQHEERRKAKAHKLRSESASSPVDSNKKQFTLAPRGIVPHPQHRDDPTYLHYAIPSNRQQSYNVGFPVHLRHLVPKMIKTGFYFEGDDDLVCCFHCMVRLKCWDDDDEPRVEHARFSPFCDFLRTVEGDKFICRVQNIVPKPHLQSVKIWCKASPNGETMDDDTQESQTLNDQGCVDSQESQTVQARRDGITCCQCKERNSCTFVPCGHLTHCERCSQTFKECPRCGIVIKEWIKTYLC